MNGKTSSAMRSTREFCKLFCLSLFLGDVNSRFLDFHKAVALPFPQKETSVFRLLPQSTVVAVFRTFPPAGGRVVVVPKLVIDADVHAEALPFTAELAGLSVSDDVDDDVVGRAAALVQIRAQSSCAFSRPSTFGASHECHSLFAPCVFGDRVCALVHMAIPLNKQTLQVACT